MVTVAVIALDFLLPFAFIYGSLRLVNLKSIFIGGAKRDLSRWGIAVAIVFCGVWIFGSWYISNPDVNHLARWLGVSVLEVVTFRMNVIRGILLVALWYGFITFGTIRVLRRQPYSWDTIFLLGYVLYMYYDLIMNIIKISGEARG